MMKRLFSRRQFIMTSAIGFISAGAVIAAGKILPGSPGPALPHPYPVLPDKPVIPAAPGKLAFFNNRQYELVATLAALLVPADDYPGAAEAGVAVYIDGLAAGSKEKQKQYTRGLQWIDSASERKLGKGFLSLTVKEQIELLIAADEAEAKLREKGPGLLGRIDRKAGALWNDLFGIGDSSGFFRTIRTDVFYGYYSNPVSWEMVGYYGPPQPAGYPDYTEPPSSGNYINTIRPINDGICLNCHFDQLEKKEHKNRDACGDCHKPHFPFQGGHEHV